MSVFIDIFNNLLKYNQEEIFIVVDKNNQIWFKLRDILKLLGYKNYNFGKVLDQMFLNRFEKL